MINEKFEGAQYMPITTEWLMKGATLDVSEEWYDYTELPLPLWLWVARTEVDTDRVVRAVREMAANISDAPAMEMASVTSGADPREGIVQFHWSAAVEQGLDAVLHHLFYHQHVAELPAIKVFGRDDTSLPERLAKEDE
jgi:hypothetical protein